MPATDKDIKASITTYRRSILPMYDMIVLGITNNYIWKCPSHLILDFYNKHITGNHLDVGVGTGYFLDKCTFPTEPRITIMDISPDSLKATAKRIARYNPAKYTANLLSNNRWGIGTFTSIGINYVLHCLPATIEEKSTVIRKLKEHLDDDGVLFGTTVLGSGIERSYIATKLMSFYNEKKLFTNTEDSPESINDILSRSFQKYETHTHGCVLFFVAWK